MKEIWRPVKYMDIDFTGHYEVSNMGKVNSVKLKKRQLSSGATGRDRCHLSVQLSMDGIRKKALVHLIVWESFMFKREKGYVIHHKDSNGLNNKLSNLEYMTHRSNHSIERTIKSNLPTGVTMNKGIYPRAQIRISNSNLNNVVINLGLYKEVHQARKAYVIALDVVKKYKYPSKRDLQIAVNIYRESIGLKRLRNNK